MRTIYNQIRFKGPKGESAEHYMPMLGERYGLKYIKIFYCRDTAKIDPVYYNCDVDFIRTVYANPNWKVPPDSLVIINREGPGWAPHSSPGWPDVSLDVVQHNVDLLEYIKTFRPELNLKYGTFANCPPVTWPMELAERENPLAAVAYKACAPIAGVSDFLVPSYYLPSVLPGVSTEDYLGVVLRFVRRTIKRAQQCYDRPIIPIIMPYWSDVEFKFFDQTPSIACAEFVWSKEVLKALLIPGLVIRGILAQFTACNIDSVIVWTGWGPVWDESAPWFKELMAWRENK